MINGLNSHQQCTPRLGALLQNIRHLTAPQHQWADELADLHPSPMLREDIGAVQLTRNVVEADDLGGNGFTDSMERKRIVPLVELGMRRRRTVDN